MKSMNKFSAALLTAVLATGLTAFADTGRDDSAIQASVAHQLQEKSELRNVTPTVQDGVVTLTGTVDTIKAKLAAEKAARKADDVSSVRDQIVVAGPSVSDAQLQEQISKKLRYERPAGGTNVFDAYLVGVKDGVVTIQGHAYDEYNKKLALDDIVNTKGVKGIVDQVKVSPASNFDDRIRMQLVRAIYGGVGPMYAMDPQAPIRIVVNNGHVGLYGVVDSEVDRTMALMRARSVFGVFDVENHLITPKDVAR